NVQQGAGGETKMLKVTVLGGATRYDTDQLVAQYPSSNFVDAYTLPGTGVYNPSSPPAGTSTPSPKNTAVVASGANFPDAVAGGAVAHGGYQGPGQFGSTGGAFPLIITDPNSLSPQAQAALLNLNIQNVLVVGGSAAVSNTVVTAIQGVGAGIQTLQFVGTNRMDTARQLATFAQTVYADAPPTNVACNGANLATGDDTGGFNSASPYCKKVG